MGRPKGSQNSPEAQKNMAKKRALEIAAAYLELDSVEELKAKIPIETVKDKIWEAQSVIDYFEAFIAEGDELRKGEWLRLECEMCGLVFAYKWYIKGVKCCSIRCMRNKLLKMGLDWDPNKDVTERWGYRIPVIVPPGALSAIETLQHTPNGIREDQSDNTVPESD